MKIQIPVQVDSDNTYCDSVVFTVRRGDNRPENVVIEIDRSRQIEVNLDDLKKALGVL